MKRITSALFSLSLIFTILAFHSDCCAFAADNVVQTEKKSSVSPKTAEVVFKTKLHCENCVKKVVENISFIKGVKDLEVSLDNQEIRIVYDIKKTDVRTLADEIKKLGYPAVVKSESDK